MDSKRKRKLKREFATLFSSDVTRLIAQTGFKFPPNVTDIMFEDEVGEPSPPTVPVAVKGAPAIAQLRPTDAPTTEVQIPESKQDKAARRRAVVIPCLKAKGWTAYRWEQEAGVSRKVGTRYLAGETNPNTESRTKLSNAIGLKDLP